MSNLCEILIVLAIVSILWVMAVPSGYEFSVENRSTSAVNALVSSLNYARSEAITRNEKVIFCKSSDHKNCGGNWRDGQIVVQGGNLLKTFSVVPKGGYLSWNSSGGQDDVVEWLPTGFTNGQRGTFYYCAGLKNQHYSRAIVLLNTGRIYVEPMSDQDFSVMCS